MGYIKNIAVIKGIKSGFSSNGGALSGLVKTEKYGPYFRAEVSYINFAPLDFGRYVAAVTDGEHTVVLNGTSFEGESDIDTSYGFAALVCHVDNEVLPVASAVCGNFAWATPACAAAIERAEKADLAAGYEDEAIAEENYYEYPPDNKGQGAVCAGRKAADGRGARQNEDAGRILKEPAPAEGGRSGGHTAAGRADGGDAEENSADGEGNGTSNTAQMTAAGAAESGVDIPVGNVDNPAKKFSAASGSFGAHAKNPAKEGAFSAAEGQKGRQYAKNNVEIAGSAAQFYSRMSGEIDRLLSTHPREQLLEAAVENSRWVRVNYGRLHYVFGVIYEDGSPAYICYGVPGEAALCPESLAGMAGFIPARSQNSGYWVMYQDARTGASVKLGGA